MLHGDVFQLSVSNETLIEGISESQLRLLEAVVHHQLLDDSTSDGDTPLLIDRFENFLSEVPFELMHLAASGCTP